MKGRTIVTSYVYPPIPFRGADWRATFGDFDEGDIVGTGATELAAITDLFEQEGDE